MVLFIYIQKGFSPLPSTTTRRIRTKFGMDLPWIVHATYTFWRVLLPRRYNFGKTQNFGNFSLLLLIYFNYANSKNRSQQKVWIKQNLDNLGMGKAKN